MQQEIGAFLQYLSSDMSASANTIAAYRNDLTQFWQFIQDSEAATLQANGDQNTGSGNDGWSAVTTTRISGFVVFLKEKGYAPTTIARKVAAVKSFFHHLTSAGVVQSDPTLNLDSPRVDKSLPRSLSADEVLDLLEHSAKGSGPESVRDTAMLQTLWSTGMRVSELVALNLDDLDLSAGYVRCTGRNGRERIIPVSLDAQKALEEYLRGARSTLTRTREEQALFVNHRGERLTRQGFWLILKGHARDAGLPDDITPQTLRHSFAINQLDQHTDLRSLQELLGHASISTTQVYAQLAGNRGRTEERVNAPTPV